jgi:NAD(P)H-hydrate epimerase
MAELFVGTGLVIEDAGQGCDLDGSEVIVDGLLGTGLAGEVNADFARVILGMNQSGAGILALDIPSGLHADTGMALGACVHADVTVTFIGLKQGLFTGQGPHYCGEVVYNDLRLPPQVLMKIPPQAGLLSVAALAHHLAPRTRSAHKGYYGHVLVIGGDRGMAGAVRLAGEAALRVGAGLVSVASRAEHAVAISQARPELMCHGVESAGELRPLLANATVLAIGPGLGQGEWARALFSAALECGKPMVVDADALNLLAADPLRRDDWVLTPHPGEAGRLLGTGSQQVQADRFAAARELQRRYGGMLVLKGAGSLVCNQDQSIGVCSSGNPGMASGGMGDVLTGVIAGLMAQLGRANTRERCSMLAARLGTCLHAQAGDAAAREAGERGLLASDLMPWLQAIANPSTKPVRGY